MAAGIRAPPNIAPGKSQEVARASRGNSLASQTIPVGKMGAMTRQATIYAIGAAGTATAASNESAPSADAVVTITHSGIREGSKATSRRPSPSASQKPEVSAAADADPRPIDSRCEGAHPPTPASVPTYSVNARTKMRIRALGRPAVALRATAGRPNALILIFVLAFTLYVGT